MQCNVGQVEKMVRGLIGVPLSILGFYVRNASPIWGNLVLAMGLLLLMTAVVAWCPISWFIHNIVHKTPANS